MYFHPQENDFINLKYDHINGTSTAQAFKHMLEINAGTPAVLSRSMLC
jgi:hypothetical protein